MSRLKLWATTKLPPPIVKVLTALRRLTYTPDARMEERRKAHASLNANASAGTMVMREGIALRCHDASREPFEWFAWRSQPMVREYDCFLELAAKATRFLDVGCSHGVYSLSFCAMRPSGAVVAVDPSPAAQKMIGENIALDGLEGRITVVPCGAGASSNFMRVRREWDHLEATSDPNAEIVPVQPIDDICAQHDFRPDLIKIDVEGYELYALQGAREVLRTRPPLLIEIHPLLTHRLGYSHADVFDVLDEVGYSVTDVIRGPLNRQQFSSEHHTFFTVCTSK